MSKKPLSQTVFEQTANGMPDNWQEIQIELWTTKEELLPELVAATYGSMIYHPLLVNDAMPIAYNNFVLLARKRQLEEAKRDGDWFKYVFTHELSYRVDALKEVASKMDDKLYWGALAKVYTESENLRQSQGAIRRLLTADRPNREAMMTDEEKAFLGGLPEAVTIFRGYGFHNSHGWSWTISREKAEWFANRFAEEFGGIPRVATGKVQKTDIIAYFDVRDEKEVVCDPKSVADITTERLDGKEDKPRVPRDDKLEFETYAHLLKRQIKQSPTMFLNELRSALEFAIEEVDTLIEQYGEETLCGNVHVNSVDSEILREGLLEMSETELANLQYSVDEALEDLGGLIQEHGDEALCGDFEFT